jgi:hypothetical protein
MVAHCPECFAIAGGAQPPWIKTVKNSRMKPVPNQASSPRLQKYAVELQNNYINMLPDSLDHCISCQILEFYPSFLFAIITRLVLSDFSRVWYIISIAIQ